MTNRYKVGNQIKLMADFYVEDVLTDPSTIVFKVMRGDRSTVDTYTYGVDGAVTKTATGKYVCAYIPTTTGNHTWESRGTGTCQAINDRDFYVEGSPIP